MANLAVAMAQTGLTVVAVDADLRHPRLHQLFGLEPGRGFSDSLRDGRVDELLHVTPYEGVRLLTCASAVDRPAATLSPDRLLEVFSALAQLADLVLVDSAPILDAADTTILAAETDGVLLVRARRADTRPGGSRSDRESTARWGQSHWLCAERCGFRHRRLPPSIRRCSPRHERLRSGRGMGRQRQPARPRRRRSRNTLNAPPRNAPVTAPAHPPQSCHYV